MKNKISTRNATSRALRLKRENYFQTLANAASGAPVRAHRLNDAIEWGLVACLHALNKDLLWSLGLALVESAKLQHRILGQGLIFSAALAGHDAALNNLSISLEQKGAIHWHRQIAKLLLEIAAKNGDPIAMWNMYFTYKKSDRDRALCWLLKARSYDEDYEAEIQRLLRIGKTSSAQIRSLSKRKPW